MHWIENLFGISLDGGGGRFVRREHRRARRRL
jgi:hypothetical protein